jgi:hypothetical protein
MNVYILLAVAVVLAYYFFWYKNESMTNTPVTIPSFLKAITTTDQKRFFVTVPVKMVFPKIEMSYASLSGSDRLNRAQFLSYCLAQIKYVENTKGVDAKTKAALAQLSTYITGLVKEFSLLEQSNIINTSKTYSTNIFFLVLVQQLGSKM